MPDIINKMVEEFDEYICRESINEGIHWMGLTCHEGVAKNQDYINKLTSFLKSSIKTAYADGQREMLRKVMEINLPYININTDDNYARGINHCHRHLLTELEKLSKEI